MQVPFFESLFRTLLNDGFIISNLIPISKDIVF